MTRNWGLPTKPDAFPKARQSRPLATLGVTALFGIIGAAFAAISFNDARAALDDLFHGRSLIMAIIAAGFGCWVYVLIARQRFAAHFTGAGDAFSDLVRFYARAAIGLIIVWIAAKLANFVAGGVVSVLLLCVSGGAGAAAAFQTVLAFVPGFDSDKSA